VLGVCIEVDPGDVALLLPVDGRCELMALEQEVGAVVVAWVGTGKALPEDANTVVAAPIATAAVPARLIHLACIPPSLVDGDDARSGPAGDRLRVGSKPVAKR
jgi:hypothetical protein